MGIIEYTSKAATAWFLGFFPYLEIYVAVPSAIALGLDYVSAVFWSVLGNFTPIPLLLFFYQEIGRIAWFKLQIEKLKRRSSKRIQSSMNRYGAWFILILTSDPGEETSPKERASRDTDFWFLVNCDCYSSNGYETS
ncbi:hypothetical protein H1P_3270004 [Hyella patelloides LEGE 07179]|uniref:Uncharacterized protein n=1 Tax=Hyella patelloides LEGE 07179 TaxID=945734 RepID=A0A563VVA2_9CYAN|nr:small multi-drug export protein [Hyella patelloides]VEP15335.1 hypothetical protein H1P_3270004 [Hyella patelloides LEGE 07179]